MPVASLVTAEDAEGGEEFSCSNEVNRLLEGLFTFIIETK